MKLMPTIKLVLTTFLLTLFTTTSAFAQHGPADAEARTRAATAGQAIYALSLAATGDCEAHQIVTPICRSVRVRAHALRDAFDPRTGRRGGSDDRVVATPGGGTASNSLDALALACEHYENIVRDGTTDIPDALDALVLETDIGRITGAAALAHATQVEGRCRPRLEEAPPAATPSRVAHGPFGLDLSVATRVPTMAPLYTLYAVMPVLSLGPTWSTGNFTLALHGTFGLMRNETRVTANVLSPQWVVSTSADLRVRYTASVARHIALTFGAHAGWVFLWRSYTRAGATTTQSTHSALVGTTLGVVFPIRENLALDVHADIDWAPLYANNTLSHGIQVTPSLNLHLEF
jgi:hypothetical protein